MKHTPQWVNVTPCPHGTYVRYFLCVKNIYIYSGGNITVRVWSILCTQSQTDLDRQTMHAQHTVGETTVMTTTITYELAPMTSSGVRIFAVIGRRLCQYYDTRTRWRALEFYGGGRAVDWRWNLCMYTTASDYKPWNSCAINVRPTSVDHAVLHIFLMACWSRTNKGIFFYLIK